MAEFREIPGIEKQVLAASTPLNPKNSEGTAIHLKNGDILLAWTQFYDIDQMAEANRPPFSAKRRSPLSDDGYAVIAAITSSDGGKTWSTPRVLADDRDAEVNTMSPDLVRLADGRLLLAYSWRSGGNHKDNYGPCAKRIRISDDEGRTWSAPVQITPDDGEYHTGCHDRAILLKSGRVLVQCHTIQPGQRGLKTNYVAYSDDNGTTWQLSNALTEPRVRGLNEGCLVQRADDSILFLQRSWTGQSFVSVSTDDGARFSEAVPSGVITPDAPSLVVHIPSSDDLLLVWNSNYNPDRSHDVSRCPLLCAISQDGGQSWSTPQALETDTAYEWAYPGILFDGDTALLHYFRCDNTQRGHRELVLARIPVDWFYGRLRETGDGMEPLS